MKTITLKEGVESLPRLKPMLLTPTLLAFSLLTAVGCAPRAAMGPSADSVSGSQQLQSESPAQIEAQALALRHVDPFIGTGGHGHTFPGALVPFGMVQLSPDNPSKGWDWTSGYHYSDDTLLGFSHTHLSGTGVGDMLDLLVMPFRGDYLTRPRDDKDRIFTHYGHAKESATPGYYSLYLPEEQVQVELTASTRTGVHRYRFDGDADAQLLIDLGYAQNYDKSVVTFLRVEDEHTLTGYRLSTGWAKNQPLYFVAKFDQPFSHQLYSENQAIKGEQLQAEKGRIVLNFGSSSAGSSSVGASAEKAAKVVEARVALSYTSIAGAKANLKAEVADLSFAQIKANAHEAWAQQLGKFQVEDGNEVNKTKFYTALYHAFVAPQVFHDVDGAFFGADGAAHANPGYGRYSLFSLWDTFRALHPLLTFSNPERVDDMVKSMLGFYDETGLLPTWDLMSNETDVMIGYHAVPVIVDAYLKGLTSADPEHIYAAIKASAMQDRFGIDRFREYGFVPSDLEVEAVSKTLEYAFDDWAIAQMAKVLGKTADYQLFSQRAQSYKTLFDAETGFMRGKDHRGNWVTPFNPTYVEHRNTDYTEANAWQYSFFVPHDVPGMMALYGDEQSFVAKLDELFSTSSEMQGDVSPDISGLIGQYAHGNEPVHHVAYLYAFTGKKQHGEARIKEIRDTMYLAKPDGLAGNDDLGQMSAWYVFSAMGFYPLNPVGGDYVLGTPQFAKATVMLPNGKSFNIIKKGDGWVKAVWLNGKKHDSAILTHQQLLNGGELVFELAE
ncbi:GH92 family glycosyl hydrolase [Shewanella sp. FJAT-52076]|uniref:GH92 family glycosyl hydrolase n=1 Tax=Shewanella sp. FJAT-52076 TaxID=2864202 RepID=UPI001C6587BE|nr:GH92 family glycosyl hydrolase [Shewanella sp. FJAT-52076]QYJ75711.1 GH92 family glycosyl hydrolase [Shewanella sp. FJAT-52076]